MTLKDDEAKLMRGDDDDDEAKRLNAGVRIEKVYIVVRCFIEATLKHS